MELYVGIGRSPISGYRLRWIAGALVVTLGSLLLVAGPTSGAGLTTTTSAKGEATGCTCGTIKSPKGGGTGHSGGGGVIKIGDVAPIVKR